MNFWSLIGFLLLVVVLSFAFYLLLRWLLSEMAKQDLFVTFRTEGEIKAIMRGEDCIRYVIKVENHIIDPDDFDIFKASLDNLEPLFNHFWTEAEKRREDIGEFHDEKLMWVKKEPEGESDEEFKLRVRQEYKQEPVRPMRLDQKGVPVTHSIHWYILDPEFYNRLVKRNDTTHLERWLGVTWVGLPPFRVFSYKFRWIKYAQKEAEEGGQPSGEIVMTPRDETVTSLYFRYPVYGIVIDDAETGASTLAKKRAKKIVETPGSEQEREGPPTLERIQLKVDLVIETITRNPQKTLFRTAGLSSAGEWISAVSREIRDRVRPWIGQVNYDFLINQKKKVQEALDKIRDEVNGGAVSSIRNYGQEIVKIALVNIDLKDETLQESINLIFKTEQERRKADLEAERDLKRARGIRALTAAPYHGKADGMERIAAIAGGAGARMRTAESIGEGGIRVLNVGGGQHTLVNLPEKLLGEEPVPAASATGTPSDPGTS